MTGDIQLAGAAANTTVAFKRDESPINDAGNTLNVALNNSTSFKYKARPLGNSTDADGNDRSLKNRKIVVPLKYLSNFLDH